jgi:hypothetical protein
MTPELEAARRLGELWALRQERLLDGRELGGELMDALGADRALLAAWSASLAHEERSGAGERAFVSAPALALAEHFRELLLRRHQFLKIADPARAELDAIYARVITDLGALLSASGERGFEQRASELLDDERRKLERFATELPGAGLRTTCAEYSPELQVELLGLSLDDFVEPVLDVGCGEQALLVRWLVERGVEAFGLDRHAHRARVIRADWLSFDFGANRFGTVVSHQAFSLHFLRHHLEPGDVARSYALAYRAILGSLRKNGKFVYAPGLPFLERLLPASFVVARSELPDALAANVREVFAPSGEDVAYACHVSRR